LARQEFLLFCTLFYPITFFPVHPSSYINTPPYPWL
jgi:hypothetical protein